MTDSVGAFEQYTDKLVEFRQFKHELGLTDEEAASHPDTVAAFFELAEIVERFPQIGEAYSAVLNSDSPFNGEAVDLVKGLEAYIAEGELDAEIISNNAYRRIVKKLLTDVGVKTKAQEFIAVFGDGTGSTTTEQNLGSETVIEDGEDFLIHLEKVQDQCYDGDTSAFNRIMSVVKNMEVSFVDPVTPEDEFTALANRVEMEISSFIQENSPLRLIELLDEYELFQLEEIYNPNNLLSLAKDLVNRSGGENLTSDQTDMLYRYKRIIRELASRRETLAVAKAQNTRNQPVRLDGARTWAGDVHPYGHVVGGVIDLTEFRDFSGKEDPARKELQVDGVTIKLTKKHGN